MVVEDFYLQLTNVVYVKIIFVMIAIIKRMIEMMKNMFVMKMTKPQLHF